MENGRKSCYYIYVAEDRCVFPTAYTERMRDLLGDEDFRAYEAAMEEPAIRSLRVNTLKISVGDFLRDNPWGITEKDRVPWCEEGFYLKDPNLPYGKDPFHHAGLIYLQEASAMAPAAALSAKPGEKVLDLCAAPGGKSTLIAAAMKNTGLLVLNEPVSARARILSENVERLGICNALVVSHKPEELSDRFGAFFDRVLVDAPCSGEGMFRKNPAAVSEWSIENVAMCAERQRAILTEAYRMLRPGGVLVYATCTFNKEEDEENAQWILDTFGDMTLLSEKKIWPFKEKGEGQFYALLRKDGALPAEVSEGTDADTGYDDAGPVSIQPVSDQAGSSSLSAVSDAVSSPSAGGGTVCAAGPSEAVREHLTSSSEASDESSATPARTLGESKTLSQLKPSERVKAVQIVPTGPASGSPKTAFPQAAKPASDFLETLLSDMAPRLFFEGSYVKIGDGLYVHPEAVPDLHGLKVLRCGLKIGMTEKGRFEPSHALALFLKKEEVRSSMELSEADALRYLKGETLRIIFESDDAGPVTESVSLFAPKGPGRQLPEPPAGNAEKESDAGCSFALSAGGGTVCAAGPSGRKAVQIVPTGPASGGKTGPASGKIKNPAAGWTLLTFKGRSLGFGKCNNGMIKNHYPKGLRNLG